MPSEEYTIDGGLLDQLRRVIRIVLGQPANEVPRGQNWHRGTVTEVIKVTDGTPKRCRATATEGTCTERTGNEELVYYEARIQNKNDETQAWEDGDYVWLEDANTQKLRVDKRYLAVEKGSICLDDDFRAVFVTDGGSGMEDCDGEGENGLSDCYQIQVGCEDDAPVYRYLQFPLDLGILIHDAPEDCIETDP